MISLKRCDMPPFHRMLTLGNETLGIRVTMGNIGRHGVWHPMRPDIFLLFRGRRI